MIIALKISFVGLMKTFAKVRSDQMVRMLCPLIKKTFNIETIDKTIKLAWKKHDFWLSHIIVRYRTWFFSVTVTDTKYEYSRKILENKSITKSVLKSVFLIILPFLRTSILLHLINITDKGNILAQVQLLYLIWHWPLDLVKLSNPWRAYV